MLKTPTRAFFGNRAYAVVDKNPYYADQSKSDKLCPRCKAEPNEPCKWVGDNPKFFKDLHIERVTEQKVAKPEPKVITKAEKVVAKPTAPKVEVKSKPKVEKPKAIVLPRPKKPKAWKNGPGTNSGHGLLWPRPDGMVFYCGGVDQCQECRDILTYANAKRIRLDTWPGRP